MKKKFQLQSIMATCPTSSGAVTNLKVGGHSSGAKRRKKISGAPVPFLTLQLY